MKDIKISDNVSTLVQKYIAKGFGSMVKNDFEVFIFAQLLTMPQYAGKNNYDLSLLLQIPETKIKRLRYEAALRYSSSKDYKALAKKVLQSAQLSSKDKKIMFTVEDVMLQKYIISLLKEDGRSIDSSFNSELLVIHLNDLRYLLEKLYEPKDVDDFMKKAKKILKEDNADNNNVWKIIFEHLGTLIEIPSAVAKMTGMFNFTLDGILGYL